MSELLTEQQKLDINKVFLEKSGAKWLHDLGFTGKTRKLYISDNLNDRDKHFETVAKSYRKSAPDIQIDIGNGGTNWWAEMNARPKPERPDFVHISMTYFDHPGSMEFVKNGGVVTCSTGNREMSEPASWDHVIDLGAIDRGETVASYSAKSEHLDLVSFVPYIPGSNGLFQPVGTSFSSPFGSGVLACLTEYWDAMGYPWTPASLKQYALDNAVDIYDIGRDNFSGAGYLRVKPLRIIDLPIGSNKIIDNGVEHIVDQGAIIVNSRTMLPVFHLSKLLGLFVGWFPKLGAKGTARIFIE